VIAAGSVLGDRAVEHPAGYEPGALMYIGLGTILLIIIIVLLLRRR
jgi:hypothetical protein